jgi:hypothetical protein
VHFLAVEIHEVTSNESNGVRQPLPGASNELKRCLVRQQCPPRQKQHVVAVRMLSGGILAHKRAPRPLRGVSKSAGMARALIPPPSAA